MNKVSLPSFSKIPNLVHGFSSREFGTMRPSHAESTTNLKKFSKSLNINSSNIIKMLQTHGNTVTWVTEDDKGKIIDKTDGLLTKDKKLFLAVHTADCIPLLFFDKKKEYIGVAHAGWRGLYGEIPQKMITEMVKKGSKTTDILMGFGPCIYPCCYEVKEDFAQKFTYKLGQDILQRRDQKIFLNLSLIAKKQLITSGIPAKNISETNICTADNLDQFYSFRKEGKGIGNFVGVIGML